MTDWEIDHELWNSKEWETFAMKNSGIVEQIKQFFDSQSDGKYFYIEKLPIKCATTEEIADSIGHPKKYVRQMLAIWNRYRCTYYQQYGKITYNKNISKWCYVFRN